MKKDKAYYELCKRILNELKKRKIETQRDFNQLKYEFTKGKAMTLPSNTDILLVANEKDKKKYKHILMMKPTRISSGVCVVAIMTKPIACKHGKCIMCPGGPKSVFGDIPQSYTGKEPATRRAIRNKFDPYLQIMNRLEQYLVTNKIPEKIELIIMGGTFPSFPKKYRENFITYAFKAMNDFSELFFTDNTLNIARFNEFFMLPADIHNIDRINLVQKMLLKEKNKTNEKKITLEAEQKRNETAKCRCIGLTIETRPDYGILSHGDDMLRLGCTRVELGIQSPYEEVLSKIKRGHTVKQSIKSIRILKDLGFKLNFHIMPGLPGVTRDKDLEALNEYFINPDFRPDMLKIYPCMVSKGTKLYEIWKKGKYNPITTQEAADMISEFKRNIPYYCRIMRVQRDIPTFMTEAGVDRTNLRQYVRALLKKKGIWCKCIRCRQVHSYTINADFSNIKIFVEEYKASKGKEYFISAESPERRYLFGLCRLRFPSRFLRKEITKSSALLRELHVYGEQAELGKSGAVQHKGLGKKLLKHAEDIAKKNKKKKMVVISGVGAREYYRKLGYTLEGFYMVKRL